MEYNHLKYQINLISIDNQDLIYVCITNFFKGLPQPYKQLPFCRSINQK